MKQNNTLQLFAFIVICEFVGGIGSVFTAPNIQTWYATLVRPTFSPPNWIFAPVWTTLFALMGIAAFLVWKKGWSKRNVKIALGLFALQLVLNALWSVIFFGLHNPGGAFVEIVLLWMSIVATMVAFGKVSRLAVWLMVPYVLWVTFAGVLNFGIWWLN